MNIEEFTKNLEGEFDELEPGSLTPDTNYRSIKNWSSMYALIIIAFVDANFDVMINASDLKNTETIRDLFLVVQSKLKS